MKRAIIALGIISFIALFTWLIISSNKWESNKRISVFKIKGNYFLDSIEIINKNEKLVLDLRLDQIDLNQFEALIEKNPFVRKAEAIADGEYLRINIEENFPEAYLVLKNTVMFVDSDFEILPYRLIKGYSDLPVVRVETKFELNNSKKQISGLLKSLNTEQGGIIKKLISEIWQEDRNIFLTLNQKSIKVILDKKGDLKHQYKNFNVFWNNFQQGRVQENFSTIDLRWKNRVVIS